MAIKRKTIVHTIEINQDNSVGVRLALQLVEGDDILDNKWHRTLIGAVGSGVAGPEEQMAEVNLHLDEMGVEPVSARDIARISMFHSMANG